MTGFLHMEKKQIIADPPPSGVRSTNKYGVLRTTTATDYGVLSQASAELEPVGAGWRSQNRVHDGERALCLS